MGLKKVDKSILKGLSSILSGTGSAVTGTAKAIYKNPRKSIIGGSVIAYLNSPLSDNGDKQRIRMMMEEYKNRRANR